MKLNKLLFVIMLVLVATHVHSDNIKNDNLIILIGASYAKSWDIDSMAGMKVLNHGSGGQETHEILARFQKDVIEYHPDIVIIWGFVNDIFRCNECDLESKLLNSKANIIAMIEVSQKNGIQPILVTEVTMSVKPGAAEHLAMFIGRLRGKGGYQYHVNSYVLDMNNWLRAEAKERGIVLLDFEQLLMGEGGYRQAIYAKPDGSHLSVAGYGRLTAATKDIKFK